MRFRGRVFGVLCAATFLLSSIATGPPAEAAPGDIVVNTSSDVEANNGSCSLREALESARTDSASGSLPGECIAGSFGGTDTIIFEGVSAPIVLGGAELLINNLGSTIIDGGSGVVIDGNRASRVLRVFPTGSVTLRNLTIQDGEVVGSSGGGILISSSANVTIEDSTITANESGRGGGILLDLGAELDLIRSTVSNNRGRCPASAARALINGEWCVLKGSTKMQGPSS